jgi:hypothetical protein
MLPGKTRRHRFGVSLMELLVSSALLGVLLAGLGLLFYYVIHYFHNIDAKNDLHTECLKAVYRLNRELSESDFDSILVEPAAGGGSTGQSISFVSLRDLAENTSNSQGELTWMSRRAFYIDPARSGLYLVSSALPNPVAALPAPATLASIKLPTSQETTIVRTAIRLEIIPKTGPTIAVPNYIQIKLKCQFAHFRKTYWAQVESGCNLKNSGSSR